MSPFRDEYHCALLQLNLRRALLEDLALHNKHTIGFYVQKLC